MWCFEIASVLSVYTDYISSRALLTTVQTHPTISVTKYGAQYDSNEGIIGCSPFLKKRCILPTGNCNPAREDLDLIP